MRLFGCVCGQFHSPASGLGLGGDEPISVPMPFYVIEHPDGVTLFDCGVPQAMLEPGDLFGDGAVTLVPSFGHTPGHQSARVRSAAGDHILVGDACYSCEVVETRTFPSYSDAAAMNRSLDALLALRDPGTVMVFGHDR